MTEEGSSASRRSLSWSALLRRIMADELRRSEQSSVEVPRPATAEEDWAEAARRVRELADVVLHRFQASGNVESEDVVQDVLVLLQSPARLRRVAALHSPGGYVAAMLHNRAYDKLRKLESMARADAFYQKDLPDAPSAVDESDAALRALEIFDALTTEERELLRLRFWEDLSLEDMSERLGISYAAAAQRLSKLLRRLRSATAPA